MDYNRSDRVGDLLLELVSQLLMKEVSDPRIGAITLTGAEVSKDLRHAKIYFSILEGSEKKTQVASGLKSATGFIRGRVQLLLETEMHGAFEPHGAELTGGPGGGIDRP